MPVEFLSDEQAARYRQYHADPSPEQLTRFFYLSAADKQFLAARRLPHTRLGCAVQLGTLRFLGTFLVDPLQVPPVVVQTLANQLGLMPEQVAQYRDRLNTSYEHQPLIQAYLQYQAFDGRQAFRLTRWLYAQVATSTVRPSVLFDLATAHLVAQRVVLPGVTVLARLIARVRERTGRHLYRQLRARLSPAQQATLEALLQVGPGERLTLLEVLRTAPTRVSALALVAALRRLEQIRALGVSDVPVQDLPEARLARLAWHAQSAWAQTLLRMSEERRLATLLVFAHVADGQLATTDLPLSVCAVLLARACNIGLKTVARPEVPALSLPHLSWVQQNYLRVETLTAANARLVDTQAQLPLAQAWGGGEVASADGMRFVVPVRTIHAGWNRKYFGSERGVTYYNFTSDQFSGFHGIVIPGTLRDSLFILAGLLEQQTSLDPREIMADTHGYSEVVFGLFSLLGFRFSPRLADLPDQRFWRMSKEDDYGDLNELSRYVINTRLIAEHWDDMLRLAGSLKLGKVKATAVMRTLQRAGSLSGLGRAVAEVRRVEKTLYLLAYVQDEAYRRRILVQLNRGEGRHAVARAVFHGKKGELRQRYREGMEDQLGALGLVVNALVLWNTRYLQQALEQHKAAVESPESGDVARLSPLLHEHINMLGRYDFTLPEDIGAGQLRPLRDPTSLEEQLAQLP